MKNVLTYFMLIIAIVFLYGFTYSINAHEVDGKKAFVDNKCVTCHSIESAEITSKKKDAVDLSSVGTDRDADFFVKYLSKETKINDKEHKTAFKGTEDELKALAEYLSTLKETTETKESTETKETTETKE